MAKLNKIYQEIMNATHDISVENTNKNDIDYSEIVIPFSQILKTYRPIDVYSGKEKIPFKERDVEYRTILRQEFIGL
ncbi:MAG: hypothetical protein ACFFA0_14310 [Promethearchaeota archaeon]